MNGKTNHGIYKRLLLVFVMTVLCALFAVSASAETISGECGKQGDNVTWTFDTETGKLIIEGIGEMREWEMAPVADTSCKYVEIKEGVTNIPMYAFYECNNLESIIIPDTVTTIGASAFSLSAIESISLPDSIEVIGENAFQQAYALKHIDLPKNLVAIENGAFCHCESLETVDIPETVEYIGDNAFGECKSLKRIELPVKLTKLGVDVFSGCYNMEECIVDPDNQCYTTDDCGAIYSKDMKELVQYPFWTDCTEYTVNEKTETIGALAFAGSFKLKKVILSDVLSEIGDGAFSSCYSLSDIILPESVRRIGDFCFLDCISIEKSVIKSMSAEIGCYSVDCVQFYVDGISLNDYIEKLIEAWLCTDYKQWVELNSELNSFENYYDDIYYLGTIRCHAGSTAEAYAKENGIDCELIHFFGDWAYDWDNLVRSHECDICGYTETEPLEKTENGGVEIVEPVDPDTEFIVEEITKNGDKYAVVEKTLSENLAGNYSILKTFDITLKNKDGVHVQPNGIVKVKLPLDWGKDGDYKVYRVNDDGTLTDMEAYREGSHMVFDSDHFSIYVIVDESPAELEDPTESEKNNSPFDFIYKVIRMFKELLSKIITFFQSIGDMT